MSATVHCAKFHDSTHIQDYHKVGYVISPKLTRGKRRRSLAEEHIMEAISDTCKPNDSPHLLQKVRKFFLHNPFLLPALPKIPLFPKTLLK